MGSACLESVAVRCCAEGNSRDAVERVGRAAASIGGRLAVTRSEIP